MTGIGAQDTDQIASRFGQYELTTDAGWLYAEARREANYERRRAFDNMDDREGRPQTFHPVDPTTSFERREGIPAW